MQRQGDHYYARPRIRFKPTFHTRADGITTLGHGCDSNKRCTREPTSMPCSALDSIQTNVPHASRWHYLARPWIRFKQTFRTRADGIAMLGPGFDSNVSHAGRHCHVRPRIRFKQAFITRTASTTMLGPGLDSNRCLSRGPTALPCSALDDSGKRFTREPASLPHSALDSTQASASHADQHARP